MKGSNLKLVIAVLSIAFVTNANCFISPALAEIAMAFPHVSTTNVQMIMTFAMLGSFPCTLIAGGLTGKLRSKVIVVTAAALVVLGGYFPLIFRYDSIVWLYIHAAIMGVGQGTLLTMLSTLITQLFEGSLRTRMFGWQSSVQNAGTTVMALVAGFLTAIRWPYVFHTTILCVPTLIFVLLWLPKGEKTAPKPKEAKNSAKGSGIALAVVPVSLFIAVFCITSATNTLDYAMLLEESNMGGPDVAGTVNALGCLVSIIVGLFYRRIAAVLRHHTLTAGCVLLVAALWICSIAWTIPVYFIGSALVFISLVLAMPGGMDAISRVVPEDKIPGSMGLFMCMQAIGNMISPYAINPVVSAVMGTMSARGAYRISAIATLPIVIFAFIWGVYNKRHYA